MAPKSNNSRVLKNPNAPGKPDVVDWRCKDSAFDTCTTFEAGRFGGDTCQQCCECECDGTTVEEAEEKCSKLKDEDALEEVSCADEGLVSYNVTLGSCASTCEAACNP